MRWEVEYTDEFEEWWDALNEEDQNRIAAGVEMVEESGPSLGRPWVDTITASRHRNMKELRPRGGFLRVLFAFDPHRTAILLLGGDKRDQWTTWYQEMVPIADRLYELHLKALKIEELP